MSLANLLLINSRWYSRLTRYSKRPRLWRYATPKLGRSAHSTFSLPPFPPRRESYHRQGPNVCLRLAQELSHGHSCYRNKALIHNPRLPTRLPARAAAGNAARYSRISVAGGRTPARLHRSQRGSNVREAPAIFRITPQAPAPRWKLKGNEGRPTRSTFAYDAPVAPAEQCCHPWCRRVCLGSCRNRL